MQRQQRLDTDTKQGSFFQGYYEKKHLNVAFCRTTAGPKHNDVLMLIRTDLEIRCTMTGSAQDRKLVALAVRGREYFRNDKRHRWSFGASSYSKQVPRDLERHYRGTRMSGRSSSPCSPLWIAVTFVRSGDPCYRLTFGVLVISMAKVPRWVGSWVGRYLL